MYGIDDCRLPENAVFVNRSRLYAKLGCAKLKHGAAISGDSNFL